MFKFSFESSKDDIHLDNGGPASKTVNWFPSKEVFISEASNIEVDLDSEVDAITLDVGSEKLFTLKYATIINALKKCKSQIDVNIFLAEENHCDLIPSKYEGGLKVWECTVDMAGLLTVPEVRDKTVLDLGCGLGLLGILAIKHGAHQVYFQDYNIDVLQCATIPTVHLNVDSQQVTKCRFFSGDWESFAESCQVSCDLIVSSETIYNPDNHLKLHDAIHRLLKPTGKALIGAKTYYFGVGGSIRQFEQLVQAKQVFDSTVVWKCSKGVQREILQLTFKNCSTS